MNYKEMWEEICDIVKSYKGANEATIQIIVENILNNLNWKKYKGDVVRPSIQFGSAHYGIPDAVLKLNNDYVLCIELKKFINKTNDKNTEQIFSYMRQLKLSFGILWGNNLQIFYDNIADIQPPIKVCEISFEKNNELGILLIENLYKENFTFEKFKKFCLKQIEQKTKETENLEKIQFLSSKDGLKYVKDLLLIEYPQEVVDKLEITISPVILETQENFCENNDNRNTQSARTKKNIAINLCQKNGFDNMASHNTTFATLNKGNHFYPANVSKNYLQRDWYLILNDEINKCYNVFKVPANTFALFSNGKCPFVCRPDTDAMKIYINDNGAEFLDIYSKISFKKYFVKKIFYK